MAERKGKKLRRAPKLANMYKLQFGLTDRNKKRRLTTHITAHPLDRQAIERYEKNMGHAKGIELSRRARKRHPYASTVAQAF